MSHDKDIIETELSEDGVFEPVKRHIKKKRRPPVTSKTFNHTHNLRQRPRSSSVLKPRTQADEFLDGFTTGMGFLKHITNFLR